MAFRTPRDVIRAKIRKLEQLEKLLDDPDIAAILPELQASRLSNAPGKDQLKLSVTAPKKRMGRKPGPLAEKAFHAIRNCMREVSAKDVLALLEVDGVAIPGKDKAVTVSKVLRKLAKAGRVASRPSGPGKKAAILYQSNALAQSFPVQGSEATH
ncbi:MAG: hypothetical protein WCA16_13790 [Candidatus Sulfotelmatobacter sp.]